MAYSIELIFDKELEKKIYSIWQQLADENINATMLDIGSWPHISLALFDDVEVAELSDIVEEFAQTVESFPLTFDSVGSFATEERVVFIVPEISDELIKVHSDLHKFINTKGFVCNQYYLPNKWLPHCTVAINVEESKFEKAIEYCRKADHKFSGNVTQIGFVEYWPVKEIIKCDFKR